MLTWTPVGEGRERKERERERKERANNERKWRRKKGAVMP